jgi:hypothetical protein
MSKAIKLSEEDREKLAKLYETAQKTPMIALSSQDMLEGRDFASLAWNDVRNFMNELGKKYGFDPKKVGISAATGGVFPLDILTRAQTEIK